MRRLWLPALPVAALACTPGPRSPAAPGPDPAPPGVAPIPLPPPIQMPPLPNRGGEGIRLGPSALRYLVHRRIHAQQEMQGQTRTVDLGVRVFLAATVSGPADSAGYPIGLTVDSLVPDSGAPIPPTVNVAGLRGLSYTGRLSPTGELRGLGPSDSVAAQTFAQIYGSLASFYPRLPAGGLTLGAAWTDTTTTRDRTGIEVVVSTVTTARATAWEERSGVRCLRLESASTFTAVGSGERNSQPMEVTGRGSRSAVHFVAADGRYFGGEVRDSSATTIHFPVEGATVPVRQVSHSTITVRP